jgi:preprotein translocase subunit SecD
MNFYPRGFNLYLLGLTALCLVAVCGCASYRSKERNLAMLRVHIENRAQLQDSGQTISLLRANPVLVTINNEPFITEANIEDAVLLQTPGGLAVAIQLDETGAYMLEQYTAAYVGKHMVIFAQWNEKAADSRWLAAPLINHRIADGVLSFTPDASPEETRQLVVGLNNMAKKLSTKKDK